MSLFAASLWSQEAVPRQQPGTPAPAVPDVSAKTGLPIGPTSGADRTKWFFVSTFGPISLLGTGPLSAAWGTMLNSPEEYGRTWEGFGKRYGMRLAGVIPSNAIEAGLGALWDEDPRYYRSPRPGFKARAGHVIKLAFLARKSDGSLMPAYARYVGTVGNNVLSNSWRARSENDIPAALSRSAYGILGRMGGNAFAEFWPDVNKKIFKK